MILKPRTLLRASSPHELRRVRSTTFRWCLRGVWALVLGLATCSITSAKEATVRVTPIPGNDVGGLWVVHSKLPRDRLVFGTCEGILNDDQDFGLFQVKLGIPPSAERPAWRLDAGKLSYEYEFAPGIRLRFEGCAVEDGVTCRYSVTNRTGNTLDRVHIHTCVRTTDAPSFRPPLESTSTPRVADPQDGDFTEMYERLFLWSQGNAFSFAESEFSRDERHLAFMRTDQPPIQWAWWVNSRRTFDVPLIALASRDGNSVAGLRFERAVWASCNAGDARACFHLFPLLGRIEPETTATVTGTFVLTPGDRNSFYQRFYPPRDAAR